MAKRSAVERISVRVTPTIDTSAYSANDVVGTKFELPYAARYPNGTGIIESVRVVDESEQGAELDIMIFSEDFTELTDNEAEDLTDADAAKLVGVINISAASYEDVGGASVATKTDVNLPYKCRGAWATDGGKSLYGQLITGGTPTYGAADDLKLEVTLNLE